MAVLAWAGVALAFLAPVPPMREWTEEPRRPALGVVNWFLLSLCGGIALLVAVAPILTAVSSSRDYNAFRARCKIEGGTVLHIWQGSRPYTCDHRKATSG